MDDIVKILNEKIDELNNSKSVVDICELLVIMYRAINTLADILDEKEPIH